MNVTLDIQWMWWQLKYSQQTKGMGCITTDNQSYFVLYYLRYVSLCLTAFYVGGLYVYDSHLGR
jgi:hypothetical protein